MQTIELETRIAAPAMRVFLLSLSVDLHKGSTAQTKEEAVAGTTIGIMRLGDEVTWRARHFGMTLHHASKITAYNAPNYFRDEMVQGLFKTFVHDHWFQGRAGGTVMRDVLRFAAPLGHLGDFVAHLLLRNHLRDLLVTRNTVIKQIAEGNGWRDFLPEEI